MGKRILLSGSNGFVGNHVLRHLLVNTDYHLVLPVSFRYGGNHDRIAHQLDGKPEWQKRVTIVTCNLAEPIAKTTAAKFGRVDEIWNIASCSDVDLSIAQPADVILNNVSMMVNLLEYARDLRPDMFLHMSTDETMGPAPYGYTHKEWDTVKPSNPYSGSKAAQEAICFSYWRTFGVPVVLTNTMNILGELQEATKMVPKTIQKLLAGEPMSVHVSPEGVSGSRFYLHARNLADAWLFLSETHIPQMYPAFDVPSRYHIVGEREVTNVELVELIAQILEVEPLMNLVSFHESRPGHDLRYALDGKKLADLGWTAPYSLEDSLRKTVEWTVANPEWLEV